MQEHEIDIERPVESKKPSGAEGAPPDKELHQLKQHAPSEGTENTCNKAAKDEQQVDQQHLPEVTTASSSKDSSSAQETVLTEELNLSASVAAKDKETETEETTTKNTTSDTILLGTDKNSNTVDNKTCETLKMSSEEAKEQEPEVASTTAKRPKTEDDFGEEKPVEMQGDEANGEDDIPAAKRPKTTDLAQPKSKAAAPRVFNFSIKTEDGDAVGLVTEAAAEDPNEEENGSSLLGGPNITKAKDTTTSSMDLEEEQKSQMEQLILQNQQLAMANMNMQMMMNNNPMGMMMNSGGMNMGGMGGMMGGGGQGKGKGGGFNNNKGKNNYGGGWNNGNDWNLQRRQGKRWSRHVRQPSSVGVHESPDQPKSPSKPVERHRQYEVCEKMGASGFQAGECTATNGCEEPVRCGDAGKPELGVLLGQDRAEHSASDETTGNHLLLLSRLQTAEGQGQEQVRKGCSDGGTSGFQVHWRQYRLFTESLDEYMYNPLGGGVASSFSKDFIQTEEQYSECRGQLHMRETSLNDESFEKLIDFFLLKKIEISVWRIDGNLLTTLDPLIKYIKQWKVMFPDQEMKFHEVHCHDNYITRKGVIDFITVLLEEFKVAPARDDWRYQHCMKFRPLWIDTDRVPIWLRMGDNTCSRNEPEQTVLEIDALHEQFSDPTTSAEAICYVGCEECTHLCCRKFSENISPIVHINGLTTRPPPSWQ
ncbi:unnamed protein product [Amoebophrya sp. A120]|nr:unnamed protein product [Amoebophrya sp. A120]|eukprot:GSA120T00025874001.1